MRVRMFFLGLLAPVLIVAVAGCGGGLGTIKVKGIVTLDGKPLPGAAVTFVPKEQGVGRLATGRTDVNGEFTLTTSTTDDGALPGAYKVTVAANVDDESKRPPPGNPMELDEKQKADLFKKMSPQGRVQEAKNRPRSAIPEIYSDPKKTPLQAAVPTTGNVEINLRSTAR